MATSHRPGPGRRADGLGLGLTKRYPGVLANDDVSIERHRRRDRRPARQKRGGQEHPDQDHRPAPRIPTRGRSSQRRGGPDLQPADRHRARHRRRPPGAEPTSRSSTVAENVALGPATRDARALRRLARPARGDENALDEHRRRNRPAGRRSRPDRRSNSGVVMIARALDHRRPLLVLDEPSVSLTLDEVGHLHQVVRGLRDARQGGGIRHPPPRRNHLADRPDRRHAGRRDDARTAHL